MCEFTHENTCILVCRYEVMDPPAKSQRVEASDSDARSESDLASGSEVAEWGQGQGHVEGMGDSESDSEDSESGGEEPGTCVNCGQ